MSRDKTIPLKLKKECIRLHEEEGWTAREIYQNYFTKHHTSSKFTTFRRALNKWKKQIYPDDELLEAGNPKNHKELLEKGTLSQNYIPHATTVQVDKNGEPIQAWIKSRAEDRLYLELIDAIKELPPIKLNIDKPKSVEDYMLEIPLFDMHFGIADYEYYKETLAEVIDLIQRRNYKEINIIIGQDLFHNDDFRGRTASGREIEYTDITVAWEDARRFYYQIIKESLNKSNKVKVIYSKGNHDESLSWAFTQMIKAQFENVEVDDEVKERKLITFGTNFIGLTHGEKGQAKSKKLNNMFVIEYPQEFARSKVREIHAGHLHSERIIDDFGIMTRRLSSGNITDTWHDEQGYVGAHKRFMVFEWTKEKLAAIYYV